jgi:hypothetical protein
MRGSGGQGWARAAVVALALTGTGVAWAQAPALEQLVTTARFGDMEFDWSRDGMLCSSCNGGQGNNRVNWVDRSGNLWVARIDHRTGQFVPSSGRGQLVDTNVAYYSDFGNGPEWAFSQQGSELVYTKYEDRTNPTPETTGIARARFVGGAWQSGFVDAIRGRITPGPSQSPNDPVALVTYASGVDSRIYWRQMGDPIGAENKAPWRSTGLSVRWLPDSTKLVYVNGVPHEDGSRYQQVLLFDTVTNRDEQLTFDATEKRGAFMFPAPEFGGDMTFFTVAARKELRVYRYMDIGGGVRQWTIVKRIQAPASVPYIATPEPFIYNNRVWVYMTLSESDLTAAVSIPTHLAITGIDPDVDDFRRLTTDESPRRLRQDPEYYIAEDGPYLYYTRAIPKTSTSSPINEGIFRINLGLGPAR